MTPCVYACSACRTGQHRKCSTYACHQPPPAPKPYTSCLHGWPNGGCGICGN